MSYFYGGRLADLPAISKIKPDSSPAPATQTGPLDPSTYTPIVDNPSAPTPLSGKFGKSKQTASQSQPDQSAQTAAPSTAAAVPAPTTVTTITTSSQPVQTTVRQQQLWPEYNPRAVATSKAPSDTPETTYSPDASASDLLPYSTKTPTKEKKKFNNTMVISALLGGLLLALLVLRAAKRSK